MNYSTRVELARALSKHAHEGQFDKGGNPYFLHPQTVSESFEDEDCIIVALLHDVLEDTSVSADTIENLFGKEILAAVVALTRREDESYGDFIGRAAKNSISKQVKIADIKNNMDLSRIKDPQEKDYQRIEKYRKALERLDVGSE